MTKKDLESRVASMVGGGETKVPADVSPPVGFAQQNRVSNEAKAFALDILRSPEYRATVRARAESGTLSPVIEQMLWHYAYGKPLNRVQLESPASHGLSELSTEELAQQAEIVRDVLSQAAQHESTESIH